MRRSYSAYYQGEVCRQLVAGVIAHNVKVEKTFRAIKVKHAEWIVKAYEKLSSTEGKRIIYYGDSVDLVSEKL